MPGREGQERKFSEDIVVKSLFYDLQLELITLLIIDLKVHFSWAYISSLSSNYRQFWFGFMLDMVDIGVPRIVGPGADP